MRGRSRRLAALVGLSCTLGALAAFASEGLEAVKQDAKVFGKGLVPGLQANATTDPTPERLPGYQPGPYAESFYQDNPDAMATTGSALASSHPGAAAVRTSMQSRPTFEAADIEAAISRGMVVSSDPTQYVTGYSGSHGDCRPLPPGGDMGATYEQSCNTGVRVEESERACPITLHHEFQTRYRYECSLDPVPNQTDACPLFSDVQCSLVGSREGLCMVEGRYGCVEPGADILLLECEQTVPGARLLSSTSVYQGSTRDESACAGLTVDGGCAAPTEVCTDSAPQTREIEGVAITQDCWGWVRTYACAAFTPDSDCAQLEGLGCTYKREACLSEDEPCSMWERVYACPIPDAPQQVTQYICDADVLCMDGHCETITREANDEFKDAAVALNAMRQVSKEFDPDTLTVFGGRRLTCAKTIFGLTNCCVPRGFPLLGGCDAEDRLLKERREAGVCHYVGTWCSAKTLGVCTKKREAHCCFESKLSRILYVEGRAQLGLAWAPPEDEACTGLTIDQFAQLDLSQMDFSEVYAEFTEAARLPDSLALIEEMKQRISEYYGGGQ